jgi:tetratricopeptide (TPR) repeat protein
VKPRIFLSAVTRELHSARQLGANILHRLGYEPVWQDIFGTEAGDLRQMLVDKIDSCDGLIHLVGFGYGAEPPQSDPEFGRVSYTQFEFLHARKTGKKTWVLFVEDGFPTDKPPEQLDLPADGHSNPAAFQAERRCLQDAWRQRLLADGHLRHGAATTADFELKFERLKDELQSLRRSFRNWQRVVVGLLFLICVLGGILYLTVFRQHDDVKTVLQSVDEHQREIQEQLAQIRPDDIKKQLRATIEETYQNDLREADKLSDWKKRADAKKDAAELRDKRLGQVDDFLASITSNIKSGEATPEYLEFMRTLQDQGPAEAVKYIDAQEQRLLAEAEKLTLQKHRTLLPILEAVKVHFNRGELSQAREKCEKLLARDHDWSDALFQHCVVLVGLENRAYRYDKIETALAHSEALEKSARRLWELDPRDAKRQRCLWVSFETLGNVYSRLGRTEKALAHLEDALAISRRMTEDDPNDEEKQRFLAISLCLLGVLHQSRGREEDAVKYYEHSLKIIHTRAMNHPNDPFEQEDVLMLFESLGRIYMKSGRAQDALNQYEAGVTTSRKMVERDSGDALKQRQLSSSLSALGTAYLHLGRTHEALKHFREHVKIARKLAEDDANNIEKQLHLAAALGGLGDVYMKLGRAEEALKHCEERLTITRKLAEADAKNVEKQFHLADALGGLGDVYMKLGRAEEAIKRYEERLTITRKLAEADAKNADKQFRLSAALDGLGGVYADSGRMEEAIKRYEDRLKIIYKLAEAADPKDALTQEQAILACEHLGFMQKEIGNYELAIKRFQLGLALLDKVIDAKGHIESADDKRAFVKQKISDCNRAIVATGDWETLLKTDAKELPRLLSLRATELAKHGRLGDVEQAAARLREWKPSSGDTRYGSARAYGLCALLVVKGKAKPSDDEVKLKRKYTDLALTCLKEAIAAGYKNFDQMKKDPDLAALRDLPEFQALFPKK